MAEMEKLYLSPIRPGQRERQIITFWRKNGEDTERCVIKKKKENKSNSLLNNNEQN